MSKAQRLSLPAAIDATLSGYEVDSYDGYLLRLRKGNLYIKHVDCDRRSRLLNHDELMLIKDKTFYIRGDKNNWESYTTSLLKDI